jgi:glutamate 5-kinase
LRRIGGLHSSQIARVLGRNDCEEAIHRDNLTLS